MKNIFNSLIILLASLISWYIRTFTKRNGSTWPGHIALHINPNIIQDIVSQSNTKIVFIAGTNGKTTTSKLLQHVLEKNGLKVCQNKEGSNMINGVATSIIRNSNWQGILQYDVCIIEVDENALPLLFKQIKPYAIIILNLFRDQLDRYGEVNVIAHNWAEVLKYLSSETHLILNGDDPQIYFLGNDTKALVHYYGLPEEMLQPKEIPHDVDSVYCPVCGTRLKYKGMSYSHLGDFNCPKGDFRRENVQGFAGEKIPYPLLGMYNVYNTHAVMLAAQKAFDLSLEQIKASLHGFSAAYGRQERLTYKNRDVTILLSKNPTGFNQSIELVRSHFKEKEANVMIILNDRIPDGQDVSWIWDVEYETLVPFARNIVISGDRTYDMAIRICNTFAKQPQITTEKDNSYSFEYITVQEDLHKAVDIAVSQTDKNKPLVILPTYSAMLEVREILVGRRIM